MFLFAYPWQLQLAYPLGARVPPLGFCCNKRILGLFFSASTSSLVFYKQGENGYYGNNVTARTNYLTTSANKAWFDFYTILPSGTLRKFYFTACNYSQIDGASTRIRLQIWRPIDISVPRMMLVWQQLVQIPTTASGPTIYTVRRPGIFFTP